MNMLEPASQDKLQNDMVKHLVGGGTITGARALYSNDVNKELYCTLVMECNERPIFRNECGIAERERLVDILFSSRFVSLNSEVNHINNRYKTNTLYKNANWNNEHRNVFMNILVSHCLDLKGKNWEFSSYPPLAHRTCKNQETG